MLTQIKQKIGQDNLAYLYWLLGSLLWVAGYIYPNQHNIDATGSNMIRGICLFIFNGLVLYGKPLINENFSDTQFNKCFPKVTINQIILRNIIITVHNIFFAQSQFYLPMPIVYTVYFSGPIFILIIEKFVYKVSISKKQKIGAIIAFFGVLMISNGLLIKDWLFGESSSLQTNFKNYRSTNPFIRLLVLLILMILTLGWSISILMVKQIKMNRSQELNIFFGVCLIIGTGLISCLMQASFASLTIDQYFWMLIYHGIPTTICQIFYIEALRLSKKTGILTMIGFLAVIFSYLISIFKYGQNINEICVIGGVMVIFGIINIVIK